METAALLLMAAALGVFAWAQTSSSKLLERRWLQMSDEYKELRTMRAQVMRVETEKDTAAQERQAKTAWVPLVMQLLQGGKLNFSDPALRDVLGSVVQAHPELAGKVKALAGGGDD